MLFRRAEECSVLHIYALSVLLMYLINCPHEQITFDLIPFNPHVLSSGTFLAGEMLHVAQGFIDKNYHSTVICRDIFAQRTRNSPFFLTFFPHLF